MNSSVIERRYVNSAICEAIARTFHFAIGEIHDQTCALDVPGWDSISNALVILEIEDQIGQELPLEDIVAAENVGAMVEIVLAYLNLAVDPE